jgi:uncharacterized protein (TIGR04552 family)
LSFERTHTSPGPVSGPAERLAQLTPADLESVRLVLGGNSVIDWHRLSLRDLEDVDRLLRVNELRPEDPRDLEYLEALRIQAVEYLERNFDFRIPDEVAEVVPVRELFLMASRKSRRQTYSCIVLKVMHIIHHLSGRELLHEIPISEEEVFRMVERKVVSIVEEIRASGHPISEFEWSRKPHDSLITKLLAKKSTIAASVYDKLRFRLVVRDRDALLPLLVELQHRLIPFNYVVPGETVNDLVALRQLVDSHPALGAVARDLQDLDPHPELPPALAANEFSGPGYRVINFIADMPIRIDEWLARRSEAPKQHGHGIVFVLTEFQILDVRTAAQNEAGENSHERYKERQHAKVKLRLTRGIEHKPVAPDASSTSPGGGNHTPPGGSKPVL